MRDHGGNIDHAQEIWGGTNWIDLSTGINRRPWPVPALPARVWTDLPTHAAKSALLKEAARAFASDAPCVALAGAQQGIQLIPRLCAPGYARILTPTYNEHAAALRTEGWQIQEVSALVDLAGADLAVVVNPNNPDGTHHTRQSLLDIARHVGVLVVDESFADPVPEVSLAGLAGNLKTEGNVIVLRSFGKFWGLAGVRLGFAFGDGASIARLSEMAGPWPVAGPALEIGRAALNDCDWQHETVARLAQETVRLDALAARAGWSLIGGTHLFRSYATPDALAARDRLARAQIWSRIFPWSTTWIRLGLPGDVAEWDRLAQALS
ncbi:threonine-phosphate decarboxylase CobD [Thioclava sp.]|uniref:threonine-phosphate decarboxylase CobD n=1 Tax=Thioclava sp. TaxID=1933450 RepID=UPI003AA9CD8A